MAVMKAIHQHAFGGPGKLRLEDVPDPPPGSGNRCPAQARTRSSPSSSSAALITTAVCEALCGSIPIITAALGPTSYPGRGKGPVAGTPDSKGARWRSRLF
jgi:hypothetical protein